MWSDTNESVFLDTVEDLDDYFEWYSTENPDSAFKNSSQYQIDML